MNRGSAGTILIDPISVGGFNEAPIHESGKSIRPRAMAFPDACFNEAPIHESGKSAVDAAWASWTPPLQ